MTVTINFCYLSLFKPWTAFILELLSIVINQEIFKTNLIFSSCESRIKYINDVFRLELLDFKAVQIYNRLKFIDPIRASFM